MILSHRISAITFRKPSVHTKTILGRDFGRLTVLGYVGVKDEQSQ